MPEKSSVTVSAEMVMHFASKVDADNAVLKISDYIKTIYTHPVQNIEVTQNKEYLTATYKTAIPFSG